MKTFLKTVCCIAFILLGTGIKAQENVTRFGVKTGLTYSDNYYKKKIAFNMGITLDFRLASDMYLLTALEYAIKGGQGKPFLNSYNEWETSTDRPAYLQLPIHFGYMFTISDFALMPHAGPYMVYGVGGKVTRNYKPQDGSPERETKEDFFGIGVGKFDYGIGVGVSAEYRKFVLDLRYDMGLKNTAKEYDGDKVNNAYLTLGYKF